MRSSAGIGAGADANNKYDAFISYSRGDDSAVAEALQRGLQRFARPWYRPRALRVFRDKTNLPATPGLLADIESALAASTWFVLVASPEAADSEWVGREVAWWVDHRTLDRFLVAWTAGDLSWSDERGDVD
jgi:hypothetical protein